MEVINRIGTALLVLVLGILGVGCTPTLAPTPSPATAAPSVSPTPTPSRSTSPEPTPSRYTSRAPSRSASPKPTRSRSASPKQTQTPSEVAFTEYAIIKTWYSSAAADNSAWVHFKAVDEGGYTVAEALGSDLMNMVEEAEAMDETPKRRALVDDLRRMLLNEGWVELGVQGEWYQYVYGR